jgi:hypothetical protein
MQLLVLYRPNSEYARPTEEYVTEFKKLHPDKEVVLMDIDSVEGIQKAEVYGVVSQPALLALANDLTLQHLWLGNELPLKDEVYGYL